MYETIDKKKEIYQQIKANLSLQEKKNADSAFSIEFTHDSTAIEGNTLTLSETKVLLEDGILPDGGKKLREAYEVINHAKAFEYIKERVEKRLPTDEASVKEIHRIVSDRILDQFAQGEYRHHNVRITGSRAIPPRFEKIDREMDRFFKDLQQKSSEIHPIERAAWVHAELVKTHPFVDGNGRTARLLMNYELMQDGLPAITISDEDRNRYITALEQYSTKGDIEKFTELIGEKVEKQLDHYIELYRYHIKERTKNRGLSR